MRTFTLFAVLLTGCQATDQNTSVPMENNASITMGDNNQVDGNLSTEVTVGPTSTGSSTSSAEQEVPVNIALDPSAFAFLFGDIPNKPKPSEDDLAAVERYASNVKGEIGDQLISEVALCKKNITNCIIEPSGS